MNSASILSVSAAQATPASTPDFFFPPTSFEPTPFSISVNPELIEEARVKARYYRPSIDLKDGNVQEWLEGPPRADMIALADYWAQQYDWSETENAINANFSHYAITVQGSPEYDHPVPLHFVHEKSSSPDAIPILLLHGWPSTHLEWSEVIKPLASPKKATDQAFHVVAPDLPGHGFSPAAEYAGLNPSQTGIVFDKLMKKLGYEKYGVASTDLGWFVGRWMADVVSDSLLFHYTDFWLIAPSEEDLERYAKNETDAEESAYIPAYQAWEHGHTGYSQIHVQNPLAIGQAMTDSPVGFAGWAWHLAYGISDSHRFTPQEIVTRGLLLWIQGTWGGMRNYREYFAAMNFPKTSVPTAVSQWSNRGSPFKELAEVLRVPRAWIEKTVDLAYFKRYESGGHFPAEHEPELWIEDVRTFVRQLLSDK